MKHKELTDLIINCFYSVYNELGYGFLEKVYERSLLTELGSRNLLCLNQKPILVKYKEQGVGDYYADIIVENLVIIEVKAQSSLCEEHEAQLTNYLKATDIEVGLLLNFGVEPSFRRKIFENKYK